MRRLASLFLLLAFLFTCFSGVSYAKETEVSLSVNGKELKFTDAKPFINDSGIVFVPAKTVFEAMGASVKWDEKNKIITIANKGIPIQAKIGDKKAKVDGNSVDLPTPSIDKNGTIFIPLNFACEAFGAKANRDEKKNSIDIITSNPKFTMLSLNENMSIGLKSDGTVWSWKGDLTTSAPTRVVGLTSITKIDTGKSFAIALKKDGTVWSWGTNAYGQLGSGKTANSDKPVQVVGVDGKGLLIDIIDVAAGTSHVLALKKDGTVVGWGDNRFYQLSRLTISYKSNVPRIVKIGKSTEKLISVAAIAAGDYTSFAVYRKDGSMLAWGNNDNARLGLPSTDKQGRKITYYQPNALPGVIDIKAIYADATRGLALKSDGEVLFWGSIPYDRLDAGDILNPTYPYPIKEKNSIDILKDVISIGIGLKHNMVARKDGSVYSWGVNTSGQLGVGKIDQSLTPIKVKGINGKGYLMNILSVTGYQEMSAAVANDGKVYVWGNGDLFPKEAKIK